MALGAAQALYPEFNPAISLKALSYFADVPRLPRDIQTNLAAAATRVREISPIRLLSRSILPGFDLDEFTPEVDNLKQAPEIGRSEPEPEI
jgi:hypothetical protein